MQLKWLFAYLIAQILFINIRSFVQQSRIITSTVNVHDYKLYMAEGKKKSRIKKGKVSNNIDRPDPVSSAITTEAPASIDSLSSSFNIENSVSNDIRSEISKLPPLQGTAGAKQLEASKKSYIEELFEPTPAGKEPKLVSLMKTVTWGAVLVLVVIEIFVSLKEGGAPFDIGKVSLPTLPSLPWLNSN